jgi:hypothetical protein
MLERFILPIYIEAYVLTLTQWMDDSHTVAGIIYRRFTLGEPVRGFLTFGKKKLSGPPLLHPSVCLLSNCFVYYLDIEKGRAHNAQAEEHSRGTRRSR